MITEKEIEFFNKLPVNVIGNIKQRKFIRLSGFRYTDDCKDFLSVPKEQMSLFNLCGYNQGDVRDFENNPPGFNEYIILDFDSGVTHEEICELFKDYKFFCYASRSCTTEKDKFRLILDTDCDDHLNKEEYKELLKRILPDKVKETVDETCYQLDRFYFMPNKGERFYHYLNEGKLFHIDDEDVIAAKKYVHKQKELNFLKNAFANANNTSKNHDGMCLNYTDIQKYLNTPYPETTGNGTSSSELFRSLRICLKYEDNTTMNTIITKAKNEKWTDKEIERMITNIRNKYL